MKEDILNMNIKLGNLTREIESLKKEPKGNSRFEKRSIWNKTFWWAYSSMDTTGKKTSGDEVLSMKFFQPEREWKE